MNKDIKEEKGRVNPMIRRMTPFLSTALSLPTMRKR